MSENRNKLIIGIALIILSIVVIAVGIAASRSSETQTVFLLFSIPAAAMIVAGGAMAGPPILSGDARLLLTGGERTITAEVLGVTRNLRTQGEKEQYYVVCKYRDPVTGKEETYTSEVLDEYPGKEVIGKPVTVRVDPSEKGKYTVELEPLLEAIRQEREKSDPQSAVISPASDEPAPDESAPDDEAEK